MSFRLKLSDDNVVSLGSHSHMLDSSSLVDMIVVSPEGFARHVRGSAAVTELDAVLVVVAQGDAGHSLGGMLPSQSVRQFRGNVPVLFTVGQFEVVIVLLTNGNDVHIVSVLLQDVLQLLWNLPPVLLPVSKLDEVSVRVVGSKLYYFRDRVMGGSISQPLLQPLGNVVIVVGPVIVQDEVAVIAQAEGVHVVVDGVQIINESPLQALVSEPVATPGEVVFSLHLLFIGHPMEGFTDGDLGILEDFLYILHGHIASE